MQPFFSIITPVFNCRKFLRKCIESVIEQTYTSWELILVDDGSTDSSGSICDDYCYEARIKVIHQENAGQLPSRIRGIAAAKGIYVLGLDADDYLDKKCLEIVKNAVDLSGSHAVFFGYRNIGYQKGCVRCTLRAGREYSQKEIIKEVIETTSHALWNKAFKLEKAREAEYPRMKHRLDINEDYVQIVSILCEVDSVYVIDDILYNYRIYENSISHSYRVKHIYDTNIATEYVLCKLKKYSLMDKQMYRAVMLAYLKMTGPRLFSLFCSKSISSDDCRKIHRSMIYKKAGKQELIAEFHMTDYIILKLFRYRQYWILKLWAGMHK